MSAISNFNVLPSVNSLVDFSKSNFDNLYSYDSMRQDFQNTLNKPESDDQQKNISSRWSKSEHNMLVEFLVNNFEIAIDPEKRKKEKFFVKMAEFIQTRNDR